MAKVWGKMTAKEKKIAENAFRTLKFGADPKLAKNLGEARCRNAPSATKHGEMVTDAIGDWVNKGFVAGPFEKAPIKNLRLNPLMAVEQRTKIRPVLNLSSPAGSSYNDAIDAGALRKIRMSSAKLFGEALKNAGRNAKMFKYDIVDAYKLLTVKKSARGHFGFSWLGKIFIDETVAFGSKAAPVLFDDLADTVVTVAKIETDTPASAIHRQLDDVPIVGPADSKTAESFAVAYKQICADVGIPLAPVCPDLEKAFENSTEGTVLGVRFDSVDLTWSFSEIKVEELLEMIENFRSSEDSDLLNFQKLHGKLANFGQMCGFTKGFRFHFMKFFHGFEKQPGRKQKIPRELKDDLRIWANCVAAAGKRLPLATPMHHPPLQHATFLSDAAGLQADPHAGEIGAACVGFHADHYTFFSQVLWPQHFLHTLNEDRVLYGHKSTTLECVGLLLPFLGIPQELTGKSIVLLVDNTAVIAAWEKKHCKNDTDTSILIRTLHIIEAFLHCKIFVRHQRRLTSKQATLADALSRKRTSTPDVMQKIAHLRKNGPSKNLYFWLNNPGWDWNLPMKIVADIREKLRCVT